MHEICHVWAGAPSYFLELLNKLQQQIWRLLVIHLQPTLKEALAHCQNVASLILFYTSVDVHLN